MLATKKPTVVVLSATKKFTVVVMAATLDDDDDERRRCFFCCERQTLEGVRATQGTDVAHFSCLFRSLGKENERCYSGEKMEVQTSTENCKHYRRRCKIRAPCCNEIFNCRHCHNESTIDRHEICRQDIQKVICLVCDTEQQVAQVCTNCGVKMGEYFCDICKFYDDDVEKGQYHCDDCGICRVGGKKNFFHCKKCGSCYSNGLRDKHSCVENSMRHHCPICYEYLFDSMNETSVLRCGHTIHAECLEEMVNHSQYSCPICSKSVIDMSKYWRKLDEEMHIQLKGFHRIEVRIPRHSVLEGYDCLGGI